MGKIAEAYVEVSAKTKEFDAGLDQSKGKLEEWVSGAQKLIAAFVIAKVGQEFLGFLGSALKASSDLTESANKAGVAFGDAFGKVSEFADGMAKKFGLIKSEVYDITAGIGFMLTNAGLSKDKAASLAIQLATSAADASSIHNMPIADILNKMKSGIAGEAEPLRVLGVNVMEENVSKQAKKMGFLNSTLTDEEKILSRIALITGGLAYASGDLANTIGEYANQTRKAAGDWENLKAVLGEEIKPIVLELVKSGYELADAFKEAFGKDATSVYTQSLRGIALGIKDVRTTIDGSATPQSSDQIHDRLRAGMVAQLKASDRAKADAAREQAANDIKRKFAEDSKLFHRFSVETHDDTFERRWAQTHKPKPGERNQKMDVADFHDWAQEAVFQRKEEDKQAAIEKNTAHAADILEHIKKNGSDLLKLLPFGAILKGPV